MATMDSGSRSSSVSSFFSDQLEDEVIEEGEDLAVYDRVSRFSRDPNYYSATKIRCSVVL